MDVVLDPLESRFDKLSDMNPLGFDPDLSMRDLITRFGDGDDVDGPTTTIQGCALATDTPPPMDATILWSASPGH